MSPDEQRASVRTYVPAYQKEAWAEHADELEMSVSEFVRTMVQAGRRGFGSDESGGDSSADSNAERVDESTSEEPLSTGVNPWGRDLETVVLDVCREEPRDFDEIVEAVFSDLREEVGDEINETLQSLQSDNRLTHDPMAGGYTVVADD